MLAVLLSIMGAQAAVAQVEFVDEFDGRICLKGGLFAMKTLLRRTPASQGRELMR